MWKTHRKMFLARLKNIEYSDVFTWFMLLILQSGSDHVGLAAGHVTALELPDGAGMTRKVF